MKRAVSLVLVIVFAMFGFCSLVSAAECERLPIEEITPELPTGGLLFEEGNYEEYDEELSKAEPVRTRGTLKPIEEYLEEQLLAHTEQIYLTDYQCIYDANFNTMLNNVIMSNYKIMAYHGTKRRVGNKTENGVILKYIEPNYLFDTVEEDIEAQEFMEEHIKTQYLDKVSDIPATNMLGKMLVIHDLFCEKNAYAYEELAEFDRLKENNELKKSDYVIYTAYSVFKNNRAVCQGNSIALKGIYDALNEQLKQELGTDEDIIETAFCSSDKLEHLWNIVKLDGKWYHLDVTWDDIAQYEEYALHEYFLVSSDQMTDHIKDGDCDWDYCSFENIVCDDKKYEDGYFFNDLAETVTSVSYESGMYSIYAPISEYPFRANSLKSKKILITDAFVENEVPRIRYFVRDDVTVNLFVAKYDDKGELIKFGKFDPQEFTGNSFYNFGISNLPSNCRLFHWSQESLTPLCRAIEVK